MYAKAFKPSSGWGKRYVPGANGEGKSMQGLQPDLDSETQAYYATDAPGRMGCGFDPKHVDDEATGVVGRNIIHYFQSALN